jgi:hypothetical protein
MTGVTICGVLQAIRAAYFCNVTIDPDNVTI